MDLQEICDGVITETEAVLNCLVFDLDSDRTLASAHRPDSALSPADMDAAIRTGKELFRGKYVDRFVQALATGLIPTRGFVREVQVANAHNYQFMAAVPGRDDAVLVLFTEKSLTLGLGWMAVHQVQDLLAESLGVEPRANAGHATPDRATTAPETPYADQAPPSPESPYPDQPSPAPVPPDEAVVDPRPVPPPSEEAAPEPLPNPLARRRRNAEAARARKSSPDPGEPGEAGNPESPDSRGRKSRRWAARNRKD